MQSGCPTCSESHGERRIREYLINRRISYTPQRPFDSCRDRRVLPFDFADSSPRCQWIIEFQGEQHFDPIHHIGGQVGFDLLVSHDEIKAEWAIENSNFLAIRFDEIDRIEEILNGFFDSIGFAFSGPNSGSTP